MKMLTRGLLVILTVELVWAGWAVARQLTREPSLLSQAMFDDPILAVDLQEMEAVANDGGPVERLAFAEALLGHGFYSEAELAFRRVLQVAPQNHRAQFGLALCLDRTGRVADSNEQYRIAAQLPEAAKADRGPEAANSGLATRQHALYAMGKNELRLLNVAAAEQLFRENAGFAPADYQLSKLLIRSGRAAEALPILAKNFERTPQSLWFRFAEYRALQELGRTAEAQIAADQLERSRYVVPLNFNTDYVEPLSQKQGLNKFTAQYNQLLSGGSMDAIARQLETMLAATDQRNLPQRSLWLQRLAEVEFQRRNPQKLLLIVAELQSLGLQNAEMLQIEGAAQALLGHADQAIALWERAAAMAPNIPLHQMLAQFYQSQGNAKAGDANLGQKALLTAKSHYWNNQIPEAVQSAREAVALMPENALAWFYLAESLRVSGQQLEAIKAYQTCLQRDPNFARASVWLNRWQTPPGETSPGSSVGQAPTSQ